MDRIVLMYHCIYKDSGKESGFQNESAFMYKVQSEIFEQEVKSVGEFLIQHDISKDMVEFTFDDGGSSFLTLAAPILEKQGFKGVFFIATSFIGTQGFLTKEQVKELEDRGHLVASHSHTHPCNMASLRYGDILNEWNYSCDILRNILGHPVTCASIPNGDSSKHVVRAAKEAGINVLYTSEQTTKEKNSYGVKLIGRYVVTDSMDTSDLIRIITDRRYRILLKIRHDIIQIAHKILGSNYNKLKTMIIK